MGNVAEGVIPPHVAAIGLDSRGDRADNRRHALRVMHRECVGVKAKDRRKLGNHKYAVVEYRGSSAVRVLTAGDNVAQLLQRAARFPQASGALLMSIAECKPLRKQAKRVDRQALHVMDINSKRECTTCGSKNREKICQPRKATSAEIKAAERDLQRMLRARG